MLKKIIFPALAMAALTACTAHKNAPAKLPKTANATVNSTYPVERPQKNIIRLNEGQNIFLKDQQMNVTFKKVTQDSRCAMNARCIWAGNATAAVEAMTTSSRPKTLLLTYGALRKGDTPTAEFSGHKITLENLYPSTTTDFGFEKLKGKYVIDLRVD